MNTLQENACPSARDRDAFGSLEMKKKPLYLLRDYATSQCDTQRMLAATSRIEDSGRLGCVDLFLVMLMLLLNIMLPLLQPTT